MILITRVNPFPERRDSTSKTAKRKNYARNLYLFVEVAWTRIVHAAEVHLLTRFVNKQQF